MPPFHEEQSIYRHVLTRDKLHSTLVAGDRSRTQHKLQLQRLSFLTNDKNYLDHPQNMRRLTRELDRVEREYRSVRRYEDPIKDSFKRLLQKKTAAMSIHTEDDGHSSNSSSLHNSQDSPNESFLGRWFSTEDTTNNDTLHDSFHPTISHHMKQRRAAKN